MFANSARAIELLRLKDRSQLRVVAAHLLVIALPTGQFLYHVGYAQAFRAYLDKYRLPPDNYNAWSFSLTPEANGIVATARAIYSSKLPSGGITRNELQTLFGVTRNTVDNWHNNRHLRCIGVRGQEYLYDTAGLHQWIQRGTR